MTGSVETEDSQSPLPATEGLLSGRYLSDNGRWALELRIEARQPENESAVAGSPDVPSNQGASSSAVSESAWSPTPDHERIYKITPEQLMLNIAHKAVTTISADLRTDTLSGLVGCYVRSRAGVPVVPSSDGRGWTAAADWVDDQGQTGTGWMHLRPADTESGARAAGAGLVDIDITFVLDFALGRLPAGFTLEMQATRVSQALRSLGLEIEIEAGQDLPADLEADGVKLTEVMLAHGLAVHQIGAPSTVPVPLKKTWAGSDVFAVLNDQLHRASQASLLGPAWELHLLLLSKTDRAGLLGVMFDFADRFPRQGAAVFVDEIKLRSGDDHARRILVTAVHELGHSLNLTHRFLRDVGRADSRSFMNYDWIYDSLKDDADKLSGNGHKRNYWQDFPYLFDRDELEFLLHGPRTHVIPGGDPFGSARYWTTGDRSLPITNEIPGLQLWLTPPARGTSVGYGQPVFLEVSLRNMSDNTYCVPRHALDLKAGMLDLLIQRRGRSTSYASADRFAPIMQRCFAVAPDERLALTQGASMHDNLNLSFGSAGSPFAEPGDYLVTPELTLYESDQQTALGVVRGNSLTITVQRPDDAVESREAQTILQCDPGIVLSLGGSQGLRPAADALIDITDRRRHERPGRPDSLVAATLRMQGLEANRVGDTATALKMLTECVSSRHATAFDPHTLAHTRKLAGRLAAEKARTDGRAAEDAAEPAGTVTYVDLAVTSAKDETRLIRRPGRLLVRPLSSDGASADPTVDGLGLAVLFNLPPVESDDRVAVSAVVNASDGISQRVAVAQLDILGDHDTEAEAFGIATLTHAVPAKRPSARLDVGDFDPRTATRADIERILATNQLPLTEPTPSQDLDPVPVADPVPPLPPTPSQPPFRWGDVISFICDHVRWCSVAAPVADPAGRPPVPTCGCTPVSQALVDLGDPPKLESRRPSAGPRG